jgi:hypothetical protein
MAICPACSREAGVQVPTAVYQPLLDQLRFANPATLAETLTTGESVLVQCHAFVGALAGTTRRILVIKSGHAYELTYSALEDVKLERVGRFFKSWVCQLVTANTPYRVMKAKEAKEATSAFEIGPQALPVFERAAPMLLEIRDTRRCRSCGAFVPIDDDLRELVPGRVSTMMESLHGEAASLAAVLEPGERLLCQIRGERFYKALVVTDRRALTAIGKDVHSFAFSQLEDVDVHPHYIELVVRGRPRTDTSGPFKPVNADNLVPLLETDMLKFEMAADLIRERIASPPS